jgi:hypothetical protein
MFNHLFLKSLPMVPVFLPAHFPVITKVPRGCSYYLHCFLIHLYRSLYKIQLNQSSAFATISSKDNLNAIAMGYFCEIVPLLTGKKKGYFYSREKKTYSTGSTFGRTAMFWLLG